MIVAAESCDIEGGIVCTPSNVNELFVFKPIFYIGETGISRTHFLILFAAFLVVVFLFAGLRKKSVVPSKIQSVVESLVTLVREDIAMSVIGKGGEAYVPYLLSIFMFILVGNLFEVAPLINFPITSRIAIPLLLSLITYVLFLVAGIRKQGKEYFTHLIWPPGLPVALKPLVGLIEFASTLIVRPVSLAVRLFANLVAGHLMLSLLLVSGYFFIYQNGVWPVPGKIPIGVAWYVFGLAIYGFEIVVSVLQAYIFTLLSAVYIPVSYTHLTLPTTPYV